MSVKIISGYSEKGGSTIALIELTNKLNERGLDTTFYGPHTWHLNKCKSGILNNSLIINNDDILICHFLQLPNRPNAKKVILASHEKWWFMVGDVKQYWDVAVFLHEEHRKYHHSYKGESVIIPNFKPNLLYKEKPELEYVAGIIGSIEDRKQTHISIKRALSDGCEKIKIFGHINDQNYYDKFVKPLLTDKIEIIGFSDDKQSMYDSIGRVYHSSKGEVACLVKDECWLTNTKFFGNEETENAVSELTNEEIITIWEKIINYVN
jgi:hypothetical protein